MKQEKNWIGSIAATRAFMCEMKGSGTPGPRKNTSGIFAFAAVDGVDADCGRAVMGDFFQALQVS
jgi:hypothetical protein